MKENKFPHLDKPRQKIALLLAPLVLTACVKTIPESTDSANITHNTPIHTTVPESENLPTPDLPGPIHTTVPEK